MGERTLYKQKRNLMEAVKTTWNIDTAHSELLFKVRHMVISTVTGKFNNFSATVKSESEDFDGADIIMEADVASISTNNTDRDNHLKSDDFFNAEKFPKLRFTNGKLNRKGEDYTLTGELTIRDVTRKVTFDASFNGMGKDPWGNTKAGFELSGKINRTDFGLNWNAALEAGGVLVSEEVKLSANIQVQID